MNLEEIKELIDILEGTDISEINIEEEDSSVSIKKGTPRALNTGQENPMSQEQVVVSETTEQEPVNQPVEEEANDNQQEIKAPMVGTFYRAPSPDAEPFVEVGDVIKEDDILCIIEAMKLMNEIEAEAKGKIVDILVEDGEAVEYGQSIFVLEEV